MKLAVSNIAWTEAMHEGAISTLLKYGVQGVEVAPTRLWPNWEGMSRQSAARIRKQYSESILSIPAMQSLLFGMQDLNVFGSDADRACIIDHMENLFAVAGTLGVGALVFGSPKNRDRSGLSDTEAFNQAAEFFKILAEKAQRHRVVLCIEPNPPQYGANFVTNWREARALVESVNTRGFGLHLDSGCIHMFGDDIGEAIRLCADLICHFHISEPHLADFSKPDVDHAGAAKALRDIDYQGWTSIEMRCGDRPLAALDNALQFVTATYYESGGSA